METTRPPLTAPAEVARAFAGSRWRWASAVRLLEREGLPALVLGGFALVFAERLAWNLNQDGWLALVGGREIVRSGFPSVDHLTVMGGSAQWVDQQWLGQLGVYGLFALGGTRLLLAVYALVAIGAFALAVVAARQLGGSARATGWVALVSFLPMILALSELRTQVIAFSFFVATFWLLVRELRGRGARLYLVLPILVVWANVHGSAILGAGLVALAGIVFGCEQARGAAGSRLRGWRARSLALVVGPFLCLFASPYALSLAGYYHRTLLNPDFGRFVSEWRPPTLSWTTAPIFLLVCGGAWLLGRSASRVSLFERLAFATAAGGALLAVRNVGWLAFVALLVLPRLLDGAAPPRDVTRRSPLGFAVGALGFGAVAAAVVSVLSVSDRPLSERYPPRASAVVGQVLRQDPRARAFADVRFADWLLWRLPEARGRVAYDARLELLSHDQLQRLFRWSTETTDGWKSVASGYSVAVLDLAYDRRKRAALVRAGARTLYADRTVAVLALPRRLA